MDIKVYLDYYLDRKCRQRQAVFEDAASSSWLMGGVTFLYKFFYHLFDAFCRVYLSFRLRFQRGPAGEDVWSGMDRLYADAIDAYHVMWVIVTFLCYLSGWFLSFLGGDSPGNWLWLAPLTLCVYRILDIAAALIEMYFRSSDARHHQFRILLHAFLHYLATGFSFALFYIFTDWAFNSFSSVDDAGDMQSQFNEWIDPIYQSLLTILAFSVNAEPQNWIGKLLILGELVIGFVLVTFIFLNITQIWMGRKSTR